MWICNDDCILRSDGSCMYYVIYIVCKDGQFNTVFVYIMEDGDVLAYVRYDAVFRVLVDDGGHFYENEEIVEDVDDRVAVVVDFV